MATKGESPADDADDPKYARITEREHAAVCCQQPVARTGRGG